MLYGHCQMADSVQLVNTLNALVDMEHAIPDTLLEEFAVTMNERMQEGKVSYMRTTQVS